MKKQNKTKWLKIIIAIVVLICINYTPMVYNRMTGNGGTFVEFYNYQVSSRNLIKKFATESSSKDSSIIFRNEKDGYLSLLFYDKFCKDYFHVWISTDTMNIKTTIIFYGVSKDKNKENAKRINRDFGIISRQYYLKRFEKILITKL